MFSRVSEIVQYCMNTRGLIFIVCVSWQGYGSILSPMSYTVSPEVSAELSCWELLSIWQKQYPGLTQVLKPNTCGIVCRIWLLVIPREIKTVTYSAQNNDKPTEHWPSSHPAATQLEVAGMPGQNFQILLRNSSVSSFILAFNCALGSFIISRQ